jgi:hypothetical protein
LCRGVEELQSNGKAVGRNNLSFLEAVIMRLPTMPGLSQLA